MAIKQKVKRRTQRQEPSKPKVSLSEATQAQRSHAAAEASAAARADPTDPFVYGRVYAHIMHGVGVEYSYGAVTQ